MGLESDIFCLPNEDLLLQWLKNQHATLEWSDMRDKTQARCE